MPRFLPEFLESCPSPVSFSGMLTMGSSFLPVTRGGKKYLEDAERTYRNLEEGVKTRLVNLAMEARNAMENEKWKDDVWLRQLDWTPKAAGKVKGYWYLRGCGFLFCVFLSCVGLVSKVADKKDAGSCVYNELLCLGPFGARVLNPYSTPSPQTLFRWSLSQVHLRREMAPYD